MGRVDFTDGHHIDAHALHGGQTVNLFEAQRFGGVQGQGPGGKMLPQGLHIGAAPVPDPVLVQHHQGGAVFPDQLGGIVTGNREMAPVIDGQIVVKHSYASPTKAP